MKTFSIFFILILLTALCTGVCEDSSQFSSKNIEQLARITPLYTKDIMVREQREYYIDLTRMFIYPCNGFCYSPIVVSGRYRDFVVRANVIVHSYIKATRGWEEAEYELRYPSIDEKRRKATFNVWYRKDLDNTDGIYKSFFILFDISKMCVKGEMR